MTDFEMPPAPDGLEWQVYLGRDYDNEDSVIIRLGSEITRQKQTHWWSKKTHEVTLWASYGPTGTVPIRSIFRPHEDLETRVINEAESLLSRLEREKSIEADLERAREIAGTYS